MKQQIPYIKLSNPGNEPPEFVIDFNNVKKVFSILNALNHKLRERLLEHLDDLSDAATLDNLIIKMKLDKEIIQQHLNILLRHKLILSYRNAANQFVYYKNEEQLTKVKRFLDELNQ